jgi:hypothetical protein
MKLANSLLWMTIAMAFALGCKGPDEATTTTTTSSPTASPSSIPVGTVTDSVGFAIGLTGDYTDHYYLHNASDSTTFTTPCKIVAGTTGASADITCLIETPELDLYHHGVQFVVNVPTTMCTYVRKEPFYFQVEEPGQGPGVVVYSVGANGTIGRDNDDDGVIDVVNATNDANAPIVDGAPKCFYDHTAPGGILPNCCYGDYTLTVRTWNAADGDYDAVTTRTNWGGSAANCLKGPAIDTEELTDDGYPRPYDYWTQDTGINFTYVVEPPQVKRHRTNMYVANYFDPADHPLLGYPISFDPSTAQPYYQISCLDRASEVTARIRIQIREWNDYGEWLLKGSGDAETTGFESGPFGTYPIDDMADWSSVINGYPLLF